MNSNIKDLEEKAKKLPIYNEYSLYVQMGLNDYDRFEEGQEYLISHIKQTFHELNQIITFSLCNVYRLIHSIDEALRLMKKLKKY